jgi:2-iminobutanoate/2-iminopropanoate deaminase
MELTNMPRRTVIEAADLPHHTNPIPTAVKIGNLVFTSALFGHDPKTQQLPDDPDTQVSNVFRAVRRVMEEAGGSVSDIGKMTVYLRDMQLRDVVNREWLKMFPEEDDRPVRHTMPIATAAGSALIQVELIAVLGD